MNPTMDNQPLEATFSDSAGREHTARLDFVNLRAIRKVTGLDLGDLPKIGEAWALVLWDDQKALDAVWLAISEDGNAAGGVSKDQWLASMNGVLLEDARRALKEAIENFTPPLRRKMLQEGMGAIVKAQAEMIAEVEERIRKVTTPAIARAVRKVRGAAPRLGKAPRNARGSSDTSTSDGRSGKRTGR